MKRQQQPNKLQLNKKRRTERGDVTLSSSSSLQSEAQPGTSSSGVTYLRRPPLPPSRIATVEPASESEASAKPRDEKSLLEKLVAEMDQENLEKDHHHGSIVKWTPLPPPNLELYLRKPVVLLEWDDGMTTSDSELDLTDDRPTNDADVVIITDDDSFADLDIGELTARLEDVEKELSFHSSQDKDHSVEIVKNQGGAIGKGGNDHIPPAPDFTDDGDDDAYGSGSDMDLFGDDDYDRLYDDVDQQLQQGQEDQRKRSSVDFSLPALVEVGHQQSSTPTTTAIPPHSRESSTDSHGDDVIMKKLIFQQGQGSQEDESKSPPDPRRGGGGSAVGSRLHQTIVETSLETVCQFTDSNPPEQQAALRARSSSSEHKLSSPDSDDLDLPLVNWGRSSSRVTSAVSISSAAAVPSTSTISAGTSCSKHVIKTEHFEQPRAHCSKDILQSSSSSTSYQPPPLVAEKCPICNISFPTGYTQLEVDEHVAVCLSAMDWEDQDEGAAEF